MQNHKVVAILFLGGVVGALAYACGPEFYQLLFDRGQSLKAPINIDFAAEVQRQNAKVLTFKYSPDLAEAPYSPPDAPAPPTPQEQAERAGLNQGQVAQLKAARQAKTGEAALIAGNGLPAAIRLYVAGAVEFNRTDAALGCGDDDSEEEEDASADKPKVKPPCDRTQQTTMLRNAAQFFKQVLELPAKDQSSRSVWAAFMLGRTWARLGEDQAAAQSFQQTRRLAREGMPDPLGLALSSLGEEARLLLNQQKLPAALALYNEQAARGSESGLGSLRQISRELLRLPQSELKQRLAEPAILNLLVNYALGFSDDITVSRRMPEDRPKTEREAGSPYQNLLAAVDIRLAAKHPQADRLAALAYDLGRFSQAEQLSQGSKTPMAHWVRAKLALRQGKIAQAASHYAVAAKAFPQVDGMPTDSAKRLQGEQAVLTLSRGEYLNALTQLYSVAGHYWLDVAYLAERVVTVEELKAFVDAKVPEPPLPSLEQIGKGVYARPDAGAIWPAVSPAAQLRDLLARRLMRAGRYDEALTYFHADGDKRFFDPDIREHAKAYADARRAADRAWSRVGKAEALFTAATLARREGINLFGYELAPDSFVSGGDYEEPALPVEKSPYLGKEELKRVKATAPKVEERYHYRYLAVDLALQAADTLPSRSQAYAAVLCRASGWMVDRDPEFAWKIYQRYVKHGPRVAWAARFGRQCVDPDFSGASRHVWREHWRAGKRWIKQHKVFAGGAGLLGMAGVATGVWLLIRRRRRSSVPVPPTASQI